MLSMVSCVVFNIAHKQCSHDRISINWDLIKCTLCGTMAINANVTWCSSLFDSVIRVLTCAGLRSHLHHTTAKYRVIMRNVRNGANGRLEHCCLEASITLVHRRCYFLRTPFASKYFVWWFQRKLRILVPRRNLTVLRTACWSWQTGKVTQNIRLEKSLNQSLQHEIN